MSRVVREVEPGDRQAWQQLFSAYAGSGGRSVTRAQSDVVWGWLCDPGHQVHGLLVVDDEQGAVGFAHYRPFARPLTASTGCFLDDLYVAEQARGSRVVDAVLTALQAVCAARGWDVVRWTTAEDNYRARATYDRLAVPTRRATYDLPVKVHEGRGSPETGR